MKDRYIHRASILLFAAGVSGLLAARTVFTFLSALALVLIGGAGAYLTEATTGQARLLVHEQRQLHKRIARLESQSR